MLNMKIIILIIAMIKYKSMIKMTPLKIKRNSQIIVDLLNNFFSYFIYFI